MTLFPILVDVEESHVGSVLRVLNRLPGVANFHLNLDAIPGKRGAKTGKHNGAAAPAAEPPKVPQRQIVIAELIGGPKNLEHLKTKISEQGHKPDSLPGTLNTLRKAGITETAGTGLHRLTDKAMAEIKTHQASAAPPGELPAPGKPRKPRGAVTTAQTILLAMAAAGGRLSRRALQEAIASAGFAPVGVDGALFKLKQDRLIKPTAEKGVFDLSAEGRKQAAKLQHPQTPTSSEEAAHG